VFGLDAADLPHWNDQQLLQVRSLIVQVLTPQAGLKVVKTQQQIKGKKIHKETSFLSRAIHSGL
jgi:hypothetical protein